MKYVNTLETIEWAMEHFGSLVTNRQLSRREVMRCVKAGLAKSFGTVLVCDDDGSWLEPEVSREGFVLTKKGHKYLMENRAYLK